MEIIISYLVKALYFLIMQDIHSFLICGRQKLLMMNKPSWAIATEGGGVLREEKAEVREDVYHDTTDLGYLLP